MANPALAAKMKRADGEAKCNFSGNVPAHNAVMTVASAISAIVNGENLTEMSPFHALLIIIKRNVGGVTSIKTNKTQSPVSTRDDRSLSRGALCVRTSH